MRSCNPEQNHRRLLYSTYSLYGVSPHYGPEEPEVEVDVLLFFPVFHCCLEFLTLCMLSASGFLRSKGGARDKNCS